MKSLNVLLLFVSIVCAQELSRVHTAWYELEESGYAFEDYADEFYKQYTAEEQMHREAVFNANLARIKAHNRNPLATWKAGVNHLTDLTEGEFLELLGHKRQFGSRPDVAALRSELATPHHLDIASRASRSKVKLPQSVDWRQKGAVTPVKDQGRCGSCWTFAAAATIESAWYLHSGELVELSEQQISSCTANPLDCGGNGGCSGGTAEVAFQGVITAGGIASEWTYPYTSWNGTDYECRLNQTGFRFIPNVKLASYVQLPPNDQDALLSAVASVGPIAISVDAGAWSSYESGVFSGCNMTSPVIDHAVQLVGYGSDNGVDYWLVRNSWGPHWGEKGYIRIARPAQPMCGVDTAPGDGTACKPYPPSQTVCGMCGLLSDSAYPILALEESKLAQLLI